MHCTKVHRYGIAARTHGRRRPHLHMPGCWLCVLLCMVSTRVGVCSLYGLKVVLVAGRKMDENSSRRQQEQLELAKKKTVCTRSKDDCGIAHKSKKRTDGRRNGFLVLLYFFSLFLPFIANSCPPKKNSSSAHHLRSHMHSVAGVASSKHKPTMREAGWTFKRPPHSTHQPYHHLDPNPHQSVLR